MVTLLRQARSSHPWALSLWLWLIVLPLPCPLSPFVSRRPYRFLHSSCPQVLSGSSPPQVWLAQSKRVDMAVNVHCNCHMGSNLSRTGTKHVILPWVPQGYSRCISGERLGRSPAPWCECGGECGEGGTMSEWT